MLINEVQYKVGLTKKSIRYYESEGLLNPKRNSNNDYREYDEKDIKDLKLIKFLRELNIPVHEIKRLKEKELTLSECMDECLRKINETERTFNRVKNMCLEIKNSNTSFEDIDITKYSETMNILNKKGFTMKDVKKKDQKKILGACLSSLSFSAIFLFFIGALTYFKITDSTFPMFLYIILITVIGVPVLGTIVNLIKRIKEIRGGEENEASKY